MWVHIIGGSRNREAEDCSVLKASSSPLDFINMTLAGWIAPQWDTFIYFKNALENKRTKHKHEIFLMAYSASFWGVLPRLLTEICRGKQPAVHSSELCTFAVLPWACRFPSVTLHWSYWENLLINFDFSSDNPLFINLVTVCLIRLCGLLEKFHTASVLPLGKQNFLFVRFCPQVYSCRVCVLVCF